MDIINNTQMDLAFPDRAVLFLCLLGMHGPFGGQNSSEFHIYSSIYLLGVLRSICFPIPFIIFALLLVIGDNEARPHYLQ